jgi:hypothetical protein
MSGISAIPGAATLRSINSGTILGSRLLTGIKAVTAAAGILMKTA